MLDLNPCIARGIIENFLVPRDNQTEISLKQRENIFKSIIQKFFSQIEMQKAITLQYDILRHCKYITAVVRRQTDVLQRCNIHANQQLIQLKQQQKNLKREHSVIEQEAQAQWRSVNDLREKLEEVRLFYQRKNLEARQLTEESGKFRQEQQQNLEEESLTQIENGHKIVLFDSSNAQASYTISDTKGIPPEIESIMQELGFSANDIESLRQALNTNDSKCLLQETALNANDIECHLQRPAISANIPENHLQALGANDTENHIQELSANGAESHLEGLALNANGAANHLQRIASNYSDISSNLQQKEILQTLLDECAKMKSKVRKVAQEKKERDQRISDSVAEMKKIVHDIEEENRLKEEQRKIKQNSQENGTFSEPSTMTPSPILLSWVVNFITVEQLLRNILMTRITLAVNYLFSFNHRNEK
jgi:hypothetical protein